LTIGENLHGFIESFLAALRTCLIYNIQGLTVNTKTIMLPGQKSDRPSAKSTTGLDRTEFFT
jgi:hypothetical protein